MAWAQSRGIGCGYFYRWPRPRRAGAEARMQGRARQRRFCLTAQIEKAGPLLGGNGALDALHQLARARQEVGTDDRVVLKDEHRRRGVAVCGACVPQNGVRHGAATLAVGHDQFGRQRARVVLAVNGRVPCASHDPRVGVGSGSRLQTPGLHTLLPHLRLDGAAAVHPTGQIDIHGDHERALPGRELLQRSVFGPGTTWEALSAAAALKARRSCSTIAMA
eukprot:scaffold19235_cov126-Isochrysis_galbana.AAC.28